MITDKELIILAGKLATASKQVVNSTSMTISDKVKELDDALNEYNNAIWERAKFKD